MSKTRVIPVRGFAKYYSVTENGDVWSNISSKWMSRTVDNHGYEVVTLRDGKTHRIHILVLEAFVSPRQEGLQGLHKDDNKRNNHLSNLRWGTHLENMRDCVVNGGHKDAPKGEDHPNAVLSEAQVVEMRFASNKGEAAVSLAKRFGITEQMVRRILTGGAWTHVEGPIKRNGHSRIDEDAVRDIRNQRVKGIPVESLMFKYGVSATAIGNILKRKTWAHVQ